MGIRRRYVLCLCPNCGEQFLYSGLCDSCGARLQRQALIPVDTIKEFQDLSATHSSPVPRELNALFVEKLLEFSKRSSE